MHVTLSENSDHKNPEEKKEVTEIYLAHLEPLLDI